VNASEVLRDFIGSVTSCKYPMGYTSVLSGTDLAKPHWLAMKMDICKSPFSVRRYFAGKTVEYRRTEGLTGAIPRNWADMNLTTCPLCKIKEPKWEVAAEIKLIGGRYLFRCPQCHGVLSMKGGNLTRNRTFSGNLQRGKVMAYLLRIDNLGTSESPLKIGDEKMSNELII
jgi:hypothetical protein